MIRSTKHHFTRFANQCKIDKIDQFIDAYRRALGHYIHELLDIHRNGHKLPKYPDYRSYSNGHDFHARLLRTISGHALRIVKSFVKSKAYKDDPSATPCVECVNPILNKINYKITLDTHFDEFIVVNIGRGNKISIPLKFHRLYHLWNGKAKRLGEIELSSTFIKISFDYKVRSKPDGRTVGADQGINKLVVLSDGQQTGNIKHLTEKLGRKRQGSRAFKRALDQRDNEINRQVKELDLSGIEHIKLEAVRGLKFKKKGQHVSKRLWPYSFLRESLVRIANNQDVLVTEQLPYYMSQRCNYCGLVRQSNRVGEEYKCVGCGAEIDSDLNAAKNHECILPSIPSWLFREGLNRTGFYWCRSGFYDLNGGSLQSPLTENRNDKLAKAIRG